VKTIDELVAETTAERLATNFENHPFKELIGRTMSSVTQGETGDNDALIFEREDGKKFAFSHRQDCCECVNIEDIVGSLDDLVGSPLLLVDESVSEEGGQKQDSSDTWTFYKFATRKGYVDVRFHGSSNGYYSESVDFFPL
jgi:hypothetical protein